MSPRLCTQKAWGDSNSPATKAPSMKISRARAAVPAPLIPGEEPGVVPPEGRGHLDVAAHEAAFEEAPPRARRTVAPVAPLPPRRGHQPVERHVLVGDDLAALFVPVGLDV